MRHLMAITFVCGSSLLLLATGCEKRADPFGKTFYLDGAGNWGYGASEVPDGLRNAGYEGDVEIFVWTTSFNPLLDQKNIPLARLRAAGLADRIMDYKRRYPNNDVNVIALSAGTGVAMWAIENIDSKSAINNFILLGSSLSADYDLRKALGNIKGKMYVYCSPHDSILDAVRLIGTIDGQYGVDCAGAVGFRGPGADPEKVVNIRWSQKWMALGWAGAHTDCTNEIFVQKELAKHVIKRRSPPPQTASGAGDRPAEGSPRTGWQRRGATENNKPREAL